jgi:diguanylate cyclase (GGDEF)-like protein
MQLYVLDEEIRKLELLLATRLGTSRISVLTELAWHLRQRNSALALKFTSEIESLLKGAGLSQIERKQIRARIALIRAEIAALFCEFEKAEQYLCDARTLHPQKNDAHWDGVLGLTEVGVALAQGQMDRTMAAAKQAASSFQSVAAFPEQLLAEAWLTYYEAFVNVSAAASRLRDLELQLSESDSPFFEAILLAAKGEIHFSSQMERSAMLNLQASELARTVGLIRLAIMSACNSGVALRKLGDYDGAAECCEWAVSYSRLTGWPEVVGFSLMRLGELMRDLDQLEQSHALLAEAVRNFASTKSGINKAIVHGELAHTLLRRGLTDESSAHFDIAILLYREAGSINNLAEHLICQARLLAKAGHVEEALKAVGEAGAIIDGSRISVLSVDLMEAMAEIHTAQAYTGVLRVEENSGAVHYLEQALNVGAQVTGWLPTSNLLIALSEAWAAAGNAEKAFEYAKQALSANQRERMQQAASQVTLMQVRHEVERAKAEAEHHRQLLATLTETSRTLDLVGKIGREITADLNLENVCNALYRHLSTLLDTYRLSIWLLEGENHGLGLCHSVVLGEVAVPASNSIEYGIAHAEKCRHLREELLVVTDDDEEPESTGTPMVRTALYAPLIVFDRVLGVMAVQSLEEDVYGERERLIFRTLCTYGAIALDNAHAHRKLLQTQAALKKALIEIEEASLTDPLTGLKNRRFLTQNIDTDVALCVRYYQNSSDSGALRKDVDLIFFLVDLDHFKQINDKYGHASGDRILVQIKQRLDMVFRDTDYLIRWGGEEFLIVARNTARARAEELAERVRTVVAREEFVVEDDIRLFQTCSVGFACFPFVEAHPRAISWQDVVDIADTALYAAKHSGRNTWVGIFAEEHAWPELLLNTFKNDPQATILNREVRLSASRPAEQVIEKLAAMKSSAS